MDKRGRGQNREIRKETDRKERKRKEKEKRGQSDIGVKIKRTERI
jgi:hypothetical protein